jgi:hypothetical protein
MLYRGIYHMIMVDAGCWSWHYFRGRDIESHLWLLHLNIHKGAAIHVRWWVFPVWLADCLVLEGR